MYRIAVFFTAFIPSLLVLAYTTGRTRTAWSNEALWNAFFLGTLTAIPVGMVAFTLQAVLPLESLNPILLAATEASLLAATCEETAKFLAIIFIAQRHVDARRLHDVLTIAVSLSLGFAAIENLFYLAASKHWQLTALARALLSVPMHGACGLIMGALIVSARLYPDQKRSRLALALVVPIFFHAAYDFPLFATRPVSNGFHVLWASAWVLAIAASATVAIILCNLSLRVADHAEGETASTANKWAMIYTGGTILASGAALNAIVYYVAGEFPPISIALALCIYFCALGSDLIWNALRKDRA